MPRLLLILLSVILFAQPASAQRGRYSGGSDADFQRFRIGLQGGYSYRIAKLSPTIPVVFKDYAQELKSGYHYGAHAAYFFTRSIGVGARFSTYRSSNALTGISMIDPVTFHTITGNMADDITINFIGPSFNTRLMFGSNDNLQLHFAVALGYLSYKDVGEVFTPFTIKGSTFGANLGLGFDVALHKNISLGIEAGLLSGALKQVYVTANGGTEEKIELPEDEYENLSRVDASAGLRFTF